MRSIAVLALALLASADAWAMDLSGHVGLEQRGFFERGIHSGRRGVSTLVADPQLVAEPAHLPLTFVVHPFYRWDSEDAHRSHFDMRELAIEWRHAEWDVRLGWRRVFWGVTESQHVVDVVNQTDVLESLDLEEKLGQPMLNVSWRPAAASFELYVLPYFRERRFKEAGSRLGPSFRAAEATYESSRRRKHLDVAGRVQFTLFETLDLAVSHFRGTNREPQLLLTSLAADYPLLTPHYAIVNQTGFEAQWIRGSLALKGEAFYRAERGEDALRAVYGFEHTLYQLAGSRADVGLIIEHSHDTRRGRALTTLQNDLFVGARIGLNNEASSELIAGVFYDLDHESVVGKVEWRHRLTDSLTLALDAYSFHGVTGAEALHSARRDGLLELQLHFHL